MERTLIEVSPPSCEPMTLDEAKIHCRIDLDETDEDTYISTLITVARQLAEHLTGRAFVERVLEVAFSHFPGYEVEIPKPPLQSVESIKYTDMDGVEQTVAPSIYQVDTRRSLFSYGRIKPAYLQTWPTDVRSTDYDAVRVRYTAGYTPVGSPTTDALRQAAVPAVLKQWMGIRIAMWHEHREPIVVGTIVADIKRDFVDGLLDPLCVDIVR